MNPLSHDLVGRRGFLLGAGGCALAAAMPGTASAASQSFLSCEASSLRKVLVHPATAADYAGCGLLHGADPLWQDAVDETVDQHGDLIRQIEASGAEVLRLEDVLDSAILAANRRGAWMPWLRATFPELADGRTVTAATLLGRHGLSSAPGEQGMHGLSHARDFAVMLPHGLVLCNIADAQRSRQVELFRFAVAQAPAFRDYPILFDARTTGLPVEGGDIMVLDRQTLLVGVGNHSDARIAAPLATQTGMDVIAVNIRNADPGKWPLNHDPSRDFFFHLNSSVAQIAPDHVMALPWLFEAAHSGGADDRLVAEFGTVAKYRGGSGKRDTEVDGLKLADYLRERGIRVSYVGDRDPQDLARWITESGRDGMIFPMRERQATNILATAPGVLLAFAGAERTASGLAAKGVQCRTIAGTATWRGYNGPNCLTLPLERV